MRVNAEREAAENAERITRTGTVFSHIGRRGSRDPPAEHPWQGDHDSCFVPLFRKVPARYSHLLSIIRQPIQKIYFSASLAAVASVRLASSRPLASYLV